MPQFNVRVADRETGEERNMTLEASSASEAERLAEPYGLIAGQAVQITAPSTSQGDAAAVVPRYLGLHICGSIFIAVAVVGLIVSVIGAVLIAMGGATRSLPVAGVGAGLWMVAGLAAWLILWAGVGSAIFALRDIAQCNWGTLHALKSSR